MKVAQIVCTYPPYKGGIGNSAREISQLLSNSGHQVTTFTPHYRRTDKQKSNTEQPGQKTVYLKPWLQYGNGAFIPGLFFHLGKFDLIYLHYPFFGGAELVWLYKILHPKTKLIIQYHHDAVSLNPVAKFLSWPSTLTRDSLFKKANKIISASFDYLNSSLIKNYFQTEPNKFVEIPFAVDTRRFSAPKEQTSNRCKILFVGGLDQAHYFKGLEVLLKALSKIDNCSWELNVVGSGDLLPGYKKLAQDLKLEKRVNFLGRVNDSDLPQIYRDSSFFVLPSINQGEAFGLVLLEAMASGLPVIASNLPGVRGVFNDNQEGLLANPNDVADLSQKIKQLITNDEQRTKMGQKARVLAETKYSETYITQKYSELLKTI